MQELHIVSTFRLNNEIVNVLIISTAANDEFGGGSGKNIFYRSVITVVEVKKNIEIAIDEVLHLDYIGLATPGELLLAKIIGGKLLQTVERHIFLINVADKMHYFPTLLQLSENPEDGFVGILVRDFAKNADRIGLFQRALRPDFVRFLGRNTLTQEIFLYFFKHKNGITDELAKIQKNGKCSSLLA